MTGPSTIARLNGVDDAAALVQREQVKLVTP